MKALFAVLSLFYYILKKENSMKYLLELQSYILKIYLSDPVISVSK